jgi:hypothetical protein
MDLTQQRVGCFPADAGIGNGDTVFHGAARLFRRDAVSQIITFGTMAAKAVIRDVGRVLGHPYGFVDRISKLVPPDPGMTLAKAFEAEPQLPEIYDADEEVKALIDMARKLEGVTRNAGKHAGGVVIAPTKITDFALTVFAVVHRAPPLKDWAHTLTLAHWSAGCCLPISKSLPACLTATWIGTIHGTPRTVPKWKSTPWTIPLSAPCSAPSRAGQRCIIVNFSFFVIGVMLSPSLFCVA